MIMLAAVLAAPSAETIPAGNASRANVTITNCLVSVSQQAQVAAREAGLLLDVLVKEGQQVASGQVLAQIDDARNQMEYRAAVLKYEEEKAQAENEIDIEFAKAAAAVADAQVQAGEEANRRVPGSVTASQMREWRLNHKKFLMEIEQAKFKQSVHEMETKVKQADVDAAAENINRRKVVAPFDGVVVELRKQKGEWAQAGDMVLRLIRVDRLWVEGYVSAAEYRQSQLLDRPVTVKVDLPSRREVFQGKVVYVSPEIEANGEFRVRAEVLNRQENDFWLLSKGANAEMTVHLK